MHRLLALYLNTSLHEKFLCFCAAATVRKNGWVVRTQPSIDVNRTDGNTVQMLRDTWNKPAGSNVPFHSQQIPIPDTNE